MRCKYISFCFVSCFLCLTSFSQTSSSIFYENSNHWVDSIMQNLSEEQRIAQLFMIAAYSNKGDSHKKQIADLINNYNVGGIMFLQGSPYRQASMTNYFQSLSKVPLMIAIDAEWGIDMRLDSALRFPWQMTLGAIKDADLIYQMGEENRKTMPLTWYSHEFCSCS